MRFEIEGFITFDTQDSSLVNSLTGDCIELSATSTRLFSSLLQRRGDIISRADIFHSVFEQYGARASNSNLNQYISTLRHNLSSLGVEKNVIITVPRIGFKISDEITITPDNHSIPAIASVHHSAALAQPGAFWSTARISAILLTASMALLLFLYFVLYHPQPAMKRITQDQCIIYAEESLSVPDILKTINANHRFINEIDCSTPKELYLFKKQTNGNLGTSIDLFLLECESEHSQCRSYYYRERKNA